MTQADSPIARRAHKVIEPLHQFVYFVPEAGQRYEALGISGAMRGYFASRSAPLGLVPVEVVTSTFYNFAPARVAKAIPSVWESTTPQLVIDARFAAADAAMQRLLPDDIGSDAMAEAAKLARTAAENAGIEGRPLYAGHARLAWPEPPHLQLWHAATLLREHRGDGHIAALVLAGLDGLDAALTYVAQGGSMGNDLMRSTRGYTEEEWAAGKDALRRRGLFDDEDNLTDAGRALRQTIEAQTDAAARAPYDALGDDATQRLIELLTPWAKSVNKQLFG